MLAYFIVSDKLGVSYKHYASQQEAITDALIWFRKNPNRVGKFEIAEAGELFCGPCETVHYGTELHDLAVLTCQECDDQCIVCGRFDDCGHDRYETYSAYLGAIAH